MEELEVACRQTRWKATGKLGLSIVCHFRAPLWKRVSQSRNHREGPVLGKGTTWSRCRLSKWFAEPVTRLSGLVRLEIARHSLTCKIKLTIVNWTRTSGRNHRRAPLMTPSLSSLKCACFRVFRLSQPEEEFAAIRQRAICTVERQRVRCWNGFPHKHLRPAVQLSARPAGPVSRSLHS